MLKYLGEGYIMKYLGKKIYICSLFSNGQGEKNESHTEIKQMWLNVFINLDKQVLEYW